MITEIPDSAERRILENKLVEIEREIEELQDERSEIEDKLEELKDAPKMDETKVLAANLLNRARFVAGSDRSLLERVARNGIEDKDDLRELNRIELAQLFV